MPGVLRVDGDRGVPHLGFQRVFESLEKRAREHGLALLLSHNAFTCAGLGYFTQRLAERGLVVLAIHCGLYGDGTLPRIKRKGGIKRGCGTRLPISTSDPAVAAESMLQFDAGTTRTNPFLPRIITTSVPGDTISSLEAMD